MDEADFYMMSRHGGRQILLYKWLGTAFLLLAGGYLSVFFNRMERKRLMVLDGYISLIRYIKGQIDCFAMPVEDIMATADPLLLSACMGEGNAHVGYGTQPDMRVWLALPEMIGESHVYLEPESERLLKLFACELGQTYRAEQVMRCDYYIQALGEERRKLADTAPLRVRMNSVLCFCCVMGVAVLLW